MTYLCAGSSDPYVEVLLMPEDWLNIKAVKTDHIKGTLNPYYQKEFNMYVKQFLSTYYCII